MGTTSKESPVKTDEIWQLSQILGIPVWRDLLSLPDGDTQHSTGLLDLEQTIGFTAIGSSSTSTGKNPPQVFVSEKTDLVSLCKILPFLFEDYQTFICSDSLIQQRLRILSRDGMKDQDNQATKLLGYILEKGASENASDIHLESLSGEKQIRMRVNGKLRQLDLPEEIDERLFVKIKLHSGMDIAQKRTPQDGHFPFISQRGGHFDLRVSTVPGIYGEKIVLRMLPTSSVEFSIKEMGFTDSQIDTIRQSLRVKSGMILFTGPTGSGKTTSLYSILKELQTESLNILTIEDPVEYRLDGITQVEVNNQAGIGFASALRSFLRQDPDVMLVGEIRDTETAQIAARAAQTGHLVLSTLHSNNVFEAIHRLNTLGIQGDDMATSLKLLVSQRLVQRLCQCGKDPQCLLCFGKGVTGRIPLVEMVMISPAIKKMLSFGEPISNIEKTAFREGFKSMRESGLKMADNGVISRLELDSICPDEAVET